MKILNKKITPYFFLAAFFVFLFLAFFVIINQRSRLAASPIGKLLMPSWHSIKKSYNLINIPYWFAPTKLPVYYLSISPSNIEELTDSLPYDANNLSYGDFLEENKKYTKALFVSSTDNYQAEIKIRYRGLIENNWNAEKKAYRLKFPKEKLFNGMKGLNLFLPDDRGYFAEMLDAYRAKKLGFLVPDFQFVRLNINQRDLGVYLAAEPWSKEWLARNENIDTNNIFSNKDEKSGNGASLFSLSRLNDWESYTLNTNEIGNFEELKTLLNLIESADDGEFAKKIGSIFDLDKFYRWEVVNVLAGSNHQDDAGNSVLLFRQETGKFEYLPWDVNFYALNENFYKENNTTLVKRILSNNDFYHEYQKVLNEYISDPDNLKDDLAYYDNLYEKYRKEFYKDQAKIDNDYVFEKKLKEYRNLIISNFEAAKKIAEINKFPGELKRTKDGEFIPAGSFKYFNDIFLDVDRFLYENTQFSKLDNKTLIVSSGIHIFSDTVVVPQNLTLIIEKGADLLFAPGASLVSYSSIIAIGDSNLPITFEPLNSGNGWGVFGVVNTGAAKNYFHHIIVKGGTSALINGVLFTSQFSLNNTNSEIRNSVFEDGRSDDALHAILGSVNIYNSVFRNTSSDGADFDFIKSARISNNTFIDQRSEGSNGDGIDLSGGENIEVSNNKIIGFGDKCISVGENSHPIIRNNILGNCSIGIAVKDSSRALIDGNIIIGNKKAGVALFRKKPEFVKGGTAEITDSVIWGNNKEIDLDNLSFVDIKRSTVKNGYGGQSALKPDFHLLLPAYIYNLIKLEL